ncbi:hypothetical protein KAR91_30800 [Candidatus Pacearchaeota archaeon]|nr:hypothetical protein [Candidatus Pacearchaeota archaeon]
MTIHRLELETDGKYCGGCELQPYGICLVYDKSVASTRTLEYIRCQACFDSEIKEPEKETCRHDIIERKQCKDFVLNICCTCGHQWK